MLAIALLPMAGFAQENLRDSLAVASDVLSYHPDSVDLRLKRAAWNVALRQWDYAKDDYDKILFKDPGNVAALFFRAYVNEKLGRYSFARLDYENLLAIVPTHYEGKLGLALLNDKDHHYTEAMDQINQLIEQNPDSASAYAVRGGMEQERKMWDAADFDFSEALRRDKDNRSYLLSRAEVRVEMGSWQEAKHDLDRLLALGMPMPQLRSLYARIARRQ